MAGARARWARDRREPPPRGPPPSPRGPSPSLSARTGEADATALTASSPARTWARASATLGLSSKPTRAGRFCTPWAYARAGSALGTPSRRESRSFFSTRFSFSQLTTTWAAPLTEVSPKTWGWRSIILARVVSATSPMSNPSGASAAMALCISTWRRKKITQLLAQASRSRPVSMASRSLVDLLQEVGAEGPAVGFLHAVPWATSPGASQTLDDLVQLARRLRASSRIGAWAPRAGPVDARGRACPARAGQREDVLPFRVHAAPGRWQDVNGSARW